MMLDHLLWITLWHFICDRSDLLSFKIQQFDRNCGKLKVKNMQKGPVSKFFFFFFFCSRLMESLDLQCFMQRADTEVMCMP